MMLGSSPGHQIFLSYQITITLLLIDFEAQKWLECRANYRGFSRQEYRRACTSSGPLPPRPTCRLNGDEG